MGAVAAALLWIEGRDRLPANTHGGADAFSGPQMAWEGGEGVRGGMGDKSLSWGFLVALGWPGHADA